MTVKTADRSTEHLYPPFREKLARVLKETSQLKGMERFKVIEGYRSAERQTWLYEQGRSRPGVIVTWKRSPTWHGTGLAADCIPEATGYFAPRAWWEEFRNLYQKHGLDNPAWGNNDLGHVQLTDEKLRARALVWVRHGFKEPPAPSAPEISVLVDGQPVTDADAYLHEGRAWVKLRPVTDGLDLVIAEVTGKGENRTARLVDDTGEWRVPIKILDGFGFVRAMDMAGAAGPAEVLWIGGEKLLTMTRRPRP